MASHDPHDARVPTDARILGFGAMLPFVVAAVAAWVTPFPWPTLATGLAIVWGGLILVFVAGVRRGFGFAKTGASTGREIAAAFAYFVPGALAIVLGISGAVGSALVLLLAGFLLVVILDVGAARRGEVPLYLARLRPPQMGIAIASLAVLLAHLLMMTA